MEYFLQNLKNNVDFFLRNKIIFSRKNCKKDPNLSSSKENLYLSGVFNKYLLKNEKKKNFILDIGSKNWSYVESEFNFFNSFCEFELKGIELDAFRVCTNLYSRYEIAKANIKDLKNVSYIPGDLLQHKGSYDYIIWILPFITKYPHLKWGLPLKYFKPELMLKYAFGLLNQNGTLLIINQGEKEYEIQKKLNEKLGLKADYKGEIEDKYNAFKNKRYCCTITKSF